MKKFYGSLTNRLEEGRNSLGREIQVGDDLTAYYYSDRIAYYVTKVINQKHIFVKEYIVVADQEKEGGCGHQNWLFFKTSKECDEYLRKYGSRCYNEYEEIELVYRYGRWYKVHRTYQSGHFTYEYETPRYKKAQPLSFGVKQYYYDWSF